MWKLVIEDDEGKRTVVPLTRDQYSIGRKDGNTIRLTERNVSREHARLRARPSGLAADKSAFALEDLTSYNGVFVNGLRMTQAQDLAHGDLVQIGDYRIVLHDETLIDDPVIATASDPHVSPAGGSGLLDRPNRLVMLAGPTPGAEFPLDRERLTMGRAEEAGISINHNSVSRLHCEVHALGDGRFEIVDKGSSNGVRVNSADLRRGIVEPGDVIELGDVKFKFIGAGQIFRPTESQKLSAIGDRAATDAMRGHANTLPIAVFAVVVLAGAVGVWVYTRPHVQPAPPTVMSPPPDRSALDQARRMCASGDCESAHQALAGMAEASSLRTTQDFKDVENRWADELLTRAEAELDVAKKRAAYQRVAQAMTVDGTRRKAAADKLQQLDAMTSVAATNPMQLPIAARTSEDASPPARAEVSHRSSAALESTAAERAAFPPVSVVPPRTAPASVDERERQLALQGTADAKLLLKQQLEQRVYAGKASDTEIRLLISTCKDLGDRSCVQQVRAIQAQHGQ
ncbi:MAG: FHA domain-containing protein [Myxococcota bacterium]|nr:FHA domain-containing protein [Myxococcota bacterium]